MTRFSIKRYMPRSLYGRAATILLVPIITIQVVVSLVFIQRLYEDVTVQMTQNLIPQLELLLSAPSQEMTRHAAILQLDVTAAEEPVEDRLRILDLSGRVIRDTLRAEFSSLASVDLIENRKQVHLSFETEPGVLNIRFPRSRVSARNPHQLLVWMLATGALMTLIAYQFLRNQLRPIKRLAHAAEAFGKGQVLTYHPAGASEVRSAGSAFLNMRSRIERQTQQRTMMLSGVSHDLRTPLTRLKLGLSMQDDTAEKEALLADVTEMEALITAFLDFAHADATEDLEECDIVDLVRNTVENAIRADKKVSLGTLPETPQTHNIRPIAIRRTLENLIGNATRYGTSARVSLQALERTVRISVEDDGPGIPMDQREKALRPFVRLDQARNQNKGAGVGLGLAIAKDVARSHGGSLQLGESEELGGLKIDLVLPR